MKIAGIDYSLRCPCICKINVDYTFHFENCNFNYITDVVKYQRDTENIKGSKYEDWTEDLQRYETLADWVVQFIGDCDQVALEGYSYSSSGRVFHIAENTGILKYKLYQLSIPLTIFPPSEIKKFATGKGNADKEKMYTSFTEETGIDLKNKIDYTREKIESPLADIVDSFYICKKLWSTIKI